MSVLIGLAGRSGCGKDTIAQHLIKRHRFEAVSLAEPIRRGLQAMFGLTCAQLNDRELKDSPLAWINRTPSQLMQTLGTEWGRHCVHEEIWLLVAKQRIADLRRWEKPADIVLTDLRFENEARFVRDLGGVVWHVKRPGYHNEARGDHASERGIIRLPGEERIVNAGDLDCLFEQVDDSLALLQETT